MDCIKNLDIKLDVLEDSISYPEVKNQSFGEALIIESKDFDYNNIINMISENSKNTNLEGARLNTILEILYLLDLHKNRYNVPIHNTIGFYFRGLPILIVKISENKDSNRYIYVSVKTYNDKLKENITNKTVSYIAAGTLICLAVFGIYIGVTIKRNR